MKIKYGGLHRKLRESNKTAINDFNELKSVSFSVRSLYELDHNL